MPLYKPYETFTGTLEGNVAELDDQEYINQHMLFAQTGEYSIRMDSRFARSLQNALDSDAAAAAEAAYNILNTVSELSRFKTLSIFDNPYDAILTELIFSSASANVDSLGTRAEAELLGLANSSWGMVQKVRSDYQPGTFKPAIQSLLTAPESLKKPNPGLYADLVQALEDYMDTEGAYKAAQAISGSLNVFGKANEVIFWLGTYQDALDWIVGCANFTSIVRAYQSPQRRLCGCPAPGGQRDEPVRRRPGPGSGSAGWSCRNRWGLEWRQSRRSGPGWKYP